MDFFNFKICDYEMQERKLYIKNINKTFEIKKSFDFYFMNEHNERVNLIEPYLNFSLN